MEKTTVKAQSKYLRQSPYKMRLVLNLIRGLDVQDALNVLTFTKRKAATEIKQLLESAIANAEANYNLNSSDLVQLIKSAFEFQILCEAYNENSSVFSPLTK